MKRFFATSLLVFGLIGCGQKSQPPGKTDVTYPDLEKSKNNWVLVVGDVRMTKDFGKVISPSEYSYFLLEEKISKELNSGQENIGILGKLTFQKIGRPVDYLDIEKGTIQIEYPGLSNSTIPILPGDLEPGVYKLTQVKKNKIPKP